MTPGARIAAAIEVLDQTRAGAAAEQALTAWARGSRFAGSKDRAAVRNHVFDVLRAKRSLGDGTGRSLMQQLALREGWTVAALFSGEGHAPAPLTEDESANLAQPLDLTPAAACDVPDWLWPQWQASLGDAAEPAARVQQTRADVFLRVNLQRGTVDQAVAALAAHDITTAPHPAVEGCLLVLSNPRRVKTSPAYMDGLVELQDASSQYAISAVDLDATSRILDFCAGGGGKALGFADRGGQVFAHDIDARRMRDLPARAARAGVQIAVLTADELPRHAPFDVVFCDAPCSGAGTWRRTPDAKWRLTAEKLNTLMQSQGEVLAAAAPLVGDGGQLIYATCSVLECENSGAISRFLQKFPEWVVRRDHHIVPSAAGDGFFFAVLEKKKHNL